MTTLDQQNHPASEQAALKVVTPVLRQRSFWGQGQNTSVQNAPWLLGGAWCRGCPCCCWQVCVGPGITASHLCQWMSDQSLVSKNVHYFCVTEGVTCCLFSLLSSIQRRGPGAGSTVLPCERGFPTLQRKLENRFAGCLDCETWRWLGAGKRSLLLVSMALWMKGDPWRTEPWRNMRIWILSTCWAKAFSAMSCACLTVSSDAAPSLSPSSANSPPTIKWLDSVVLPFL